MIVWSFPYAFGLLLLPFVFYALMPVLKGVHGDALRFPYLPDLKRIALASGGLWTAASTPQKLSLRFFLLYMVWGLLCVAAARPQQVGEPLPLQNEGRDIMLVLDISTSMLEKDFSYQGRRISRLAAVKNVVSDFVDKRANDRLGLILFGTRAYLQAPLTFDKAGVKDILWSMQAGMAGDSTSIGDALALALKTLQNQNGDKVIVLLTDGENNDGALSIGQAVKMAADAGIKTYTIGVGAPSVFFKMFAPIAQKADDTVLKQVAALTKGTYFRAESLSDLQNVYQEIDQLETSTTDERYVQEITELYYIPLLGTLILSCLFVLLGQKRGTL
jgi:Ca-activated chloride channel family protein